MSLTLEYANNSQKMSPRESSTFIKYEESPEYMQDPNFQSPYNIAKMKSKGREFSSCFKINDSGYFSLGGDTETKNKTYINLIQTQYDLCELVNKTSGCTLTDAEFSSIASIDFILLLRNSYANYQSDSGISEFYEGFKFKLDYESDYLFKFTSKRLKISTDRNLIYNVFPNEENQKYIQSLAVTSEKKSRSKNIFLVSFEFALSNYVEAIDRSYLKVDGMLANVGSIVVIIEFFAKLLAEFFSEANMEHSIYKEVYHIQKAEKKTEFLNVDFNGFKLSKKNNHALKKAKDENGNGIIVINNNIDGIEKDSNKDNYKEDIIKNNHNNNKENKEVIEDKEKPKFKLFNMKNKNQTSRNVSFSDKTGIESNIKEINFNDEKTNINKEINCENVNISGMLRAFNFNSENEKINNEKNSNNSNINNISFFSNINKEKSDISIKQLVKKTKKLLIFSNIKIKYTKKTSSYTDLLESQKQIVLN